MCFDSCLYGGAISPLNGNLSSCRCSRENYSLHCCDVPPASCKISAGRTIQNSVERVIWSRVLHYLSDFKIRSLFCALLETEKTLLCVIEMRKGPFRVRRPGARIALFPRRNSRSALPREIPIFAFSLKRFPGRSGTCGTPFSRGPENQEIEHLLV